VTNPHGQPFVLIGVNVSGYGVRRPENRSAARAFGVLNYDMSFRHWAVPDFANGWIPDAACRQRNVMGIGPPVQLRRVGVSDRRGQMRAAELRGCAPPVRVASRQWCPILAGQVGARGQPCSATNVVTPMVRSRQRKLPEVDVT
jgi:hypothetical protein